MGSPSRTRRRRALRQIVRCPDCHSEVRIVGTASPNPTVEVRHDATCPWLAAQSGGAGRVREIRVLTRESK